MEKVVLTGNTLTLEELVLAARHGTQVEIDPEAKIRITRSRSIIDDFVEREQVVYGVTTGIGKFCEVFISKEDCAKLQENIIITHAAGAGDPLSAEVVRGIILLRLNNFAKGYSGIRIDTVNTMVEMLNKGVHPVIPEKGSLGASGDLAPLAHMVLPMIGRGKAEYKGQILDGAEAMKRAGIPMVELCAKEGVALINGTQVMTSIGALALYDAMNLSKVADLVAALTFEACNGIVTALDKKVHMVRPHKGQQDTAKNLRQLLEESQMTTKQGDIRVQDPYTLRCVPQIHGASKNALHYVKSQVDVEMNSVTDNPIIFPDEGEVISGGNFHGQPMAISFDFMSIAVAELANVSERRIERLVNPQLNYGLPGFLVADGGLNSGYMILQYTAAALVSENKVLAHPSSVDSITSSANQEDHVSMGTIGARKAAVIVDNVRRVLATELACAAQAIDLRGKKQLGKGTEAAYQAVRSVLPEMKEDREVYHDVNICEQLLVSGELIRKAEESAGEIIV